MMRRVATALAGTVVLAVAAGCAHQESFELPDLAPSGVAPGVQVYPNYGYGTGFPGGFQPGYGDDYGYANPWYAAPGPYPYGYGYAYNAYPRYLVMPCVDGNRDGQCDPRPPKQRHERTPHGRDVDDSTAPPRHGERPRVRNDDEREIVPNAQRRAAPVPAPVDQQPARVRPEPRRASSPPTQEP
jgi:hypothetical protein